MAQLNITLNHEEILQLMSLDRNEAFKNLLKECLNLFMRAESEEQLGARPYERTSGRTDSRNGSYTRVKDKNRNYRTNGSQTQKRSV